MKHTMYVNNKLCILDIEVGGKLKKRLSDSVAKDFIVSLLNGENPGLDRTVTSSDSGFFFQVSSDDEKYGIIGYRDVEAEDVRHQALCIVLRVFEPAEYKELTKEIEVTGTADPKVKYVN